MDIYIKSLYWIKNISIWLVVNFALTLLPIFVVLLIGGKNETIIASMVAFMFTRLVGSIYSYVSSNMDYSISSLGILFWSAFTAILLSLLLYPLFLLLPRVSEFICDISLLFIIVSLAVTISLCFFLNIGTLQNWVQKNYSNYIINKSSQKIRKNFEEGIKTL